MPDFSTLISSLKSPRTSLAVFLFSAGLLYAPFEALGITRPNFTVEYESIFVVLLFLAGAILIVEFLVFLGRIIKKPYLIWKRRATVEKIFLSLNLAELCVLWAMTQSGTKTIKGSSSNHTMLSLRQKGCLHITSGIQYLNQLHHEMPDDLYQIVAKRGYERMPDDFKEAASFQDDVRNYVDMATDRWS